MLWVCHQLEVILGLEYMDKGPNFMSPAPALGNRGHVSARHFAKSEAGTGREDSLNHTHPLSGMFVTPPEKGHPTAQTTFLLWVRSCCKWVLPGPWEWPGRPFQHQDQVVNREPVK